MKRLSVAAALALALAALAGTAARASTFAIVPTAVQTAAPIFVPSAETPNAPDSLLLPADWTAHAGSQHELSFAALYSLWRSAGDAYGIPWQVLASINKIESNFGRNMGPSSAGAVGWMQFMPDTWLRWGMDGDADGVADPWNPYDGVYSAARYLAAAGGSNDLERAVFAYNHADWYVREVLDLARVYGGDAGSEVAFELDRVQVALDDAQRNVARANRSLVAAIRVDRALERRQNRLVARADATRVLSDALALRKRAVAVGVGRAPVQERIQILREALDAARDALLDARSVADGASLTPGARLLVGAAMYSGGYVFPVGGGPAVASVARTHHDYPAADIAAPSGTPVYALADAIVERAWAVPDGRCGIGLTIQTADGQTWTYCHLSYLEPRVQSGVFLAAGDVVGLVGSTGRSTGPHLHLQLHPATSYPQEQAWFLQFAGSAFSWQDEPAPERTLAMAAPAAVFAVLPSPEPEDDIVLFTRSGG